MTDVSYFRNMWCNGTVVRITYHCFLKSLPMPLDQTDVLSAQQQTKTEINVSVIPPLTGTFSYLSFRAVLLTGYCTVTCHRSSKHSQCSSYGTCSNDIHNGKFWHRSPTLQPTSLKFSSTYTKTHTLHLFFL
jgi:hypothetical protein